MILFTAVLSGRDGFLMFLLLLPVLWMYSSFDAIRQLNKKARGEELVDESLLSISKKNKKVKPLQQYFPSFRESVIYT